MSDTPAGSYVYDRSMAKMGYQLSKMAGSLAKKENRDAFLRDEDAYLDRYRLTPEQRAAVKERNWLRLIQLGGNIYYIYKLTALVSPMQMSELGALQAGLPHDVFLEKIASEG